MSSWISGRFRLFHSPTTSWRFLLLVAVFLQHISGFKYHRDLQRGYTALETIIKRGVERICDSEAERILFKCRRPLVRLSGDGSEGDVNTKVTHILSEETQIPLDEVARRLRDEIKKETAYVQDCTITGNGYVNVYLKDSFIRGCLRSMSNDATHRIGVPLMCDERVVIDYFSPNVGKELHMGHLRSAAVGGAIANILEFCGSKVLRRSHVGDFGAQSGQIIRYLVEYDPTSLEAYSAESADWQRQLEIERQSLDYSIWDLKKIHTSGRLSLPTPSTCRELISNTIGEIYKLAKETYDRNSDFARRCKEETALLQQGNDMHQKVWNNIAKTSSGTYRDILERFKLEKVRDIPESCYAKRVFDLVNRWVEEGLATRKPDGSVTITIGARNVKETGNEETLHSGTLSKDGTIIKFNTEPPLSQGNQDTSKESCDNGSIHSGSMNDIPNNQEDALGDDTNLGSESGDPHVSNELVLITKEGAATYLAVDLAALAHRVNSNKAGRLIYVTDHGQKEHFAKVEMIARQVGILKHQEMEHLSFGAVKAPSGKKMRSRSGVITGIEPVWIDTVEAFKKEVARKGEYIGQMGEFMAKKLAAGSILFADLSTAQHENYTFSIDRLLNLGGNSLIAILYCYVRARSIQRKIQKENLVTDLAPGLDAAKEAFRNTSSRKLALSLIGLENAIFTAAHLRAPHRLCKYIYTLSREFSRFYEGTKVIENQVSNPESVELVNLVSRVIKLVLSLLNIETTERL